MFGSVLGSVLVDVLNLGLVRVTVSVTVWVDVAVSNTIPVEARGCASCVDNYNLAVQALC